MFFLTFKLQDVMCKIYSRQGTSSLSDVRNIEASKMIIHLIFV